MITKAEIALKSAFICSAILLAFKTGEACSEEPRLQTAETETALQNHPPSADGQPAGFDERWSAKSTDYVTGADGVITPLSATPANSSYTPDNTYIPDGSLLNFTDRKHQENRLAAAAGTNDPAPSAAQVQECGPSPFPPEKIKTLVEETARRYAVDASFATAIARTESRFDLSRNSGKGARGPMQLMPETAIRFGVQDVCDPQANIEGGIKYLRALLDEFQNPLLAAAAYNAGENRIYEYGGIPPLPETVSYVAKVVNYQLGLPDFAGRPKESKGNRKIIKAGSDTTETGIITVKKNRTFVGGVMSF